MYIFNKFLYVFFALLVSLSTLLSNNKLERVIIHNIEYIKASEFAKSYQANTIFYSDKDKLEIRLKNLKITLSPYSSFLKIDDNIYHMSSMVLHLNDEFYIPLNSFSKIVANTKYPLIKINEVNKQIEISEPKYNVNSFNINKKINGAVIDIKTDIYFPEKSISASISRGGWLNITIPNGYLDSLQMSNMKIKAPIQRYKTYQSNESCQLSFLLEKKVDDIEINTSEENINIILRIETNTSTNKIKKMREDWFLDTIIIDAGHGGKDPGAIGKKGLQEKTITLDVAKKLKKLITKNTDITVVMTRNEDSFVPLWKRTKMANENDGKLLISIHANSASKSPRARGFETYLLRPGKFDDAVEIVKRENDVIKLEEDAGKYINLNDEGFISASIEQNIYIKESEFFAAEIQKQIDKVSTSPNRGVKQAGFYVLVGASMPNVLIELGFLSNKNEEKMLGKSSYRQKLANSIFEAVLVFKERYESQTIEE